MRPLFSFLVLFFILFSCNQRPLIVQTQYLNRNSLASYHVGTPDPKLTNPDIGEQLIIQWALPKNTALSHTLSLHIKIRFHNREEISRSIPVDQPSGTYVYTLLNQEFLKSRGILTYKVQLIDEDRVIDEWQHQLWTALIVLQKEEAAE